MESRPSFYKLATSLGSLLVVSAFLIACSKDKKDSAANPGYYCDAYGCYQTTGQPYDPNNPYNYPYQFQNAPNGGLPASATVGEGALSVTNRSIWKAVLDTLVNCRQPVGPFNNSYCGAMNGGRIYTRVVVMDYNFSGPKRTSDGYIIIQGEYSGSTYHPVVWTRAEDGSSFYTQLNYTMVNSYRPGTPNKVRIYAFGRANGSYVNLIMRYGNDEFARGRVSRTNLPR